jgi:hypothetical protein
MAAAAPAYRLGLLLRMGRKAVAAGRRGWEEPYAGAARDLVGSLAAVEHLVECQEGREVLLHLPLGSMHLLLGPVS